MKLFLRNVTSLILIVLTMSACNDPYLGPYFVRVRMDDGTGHYPYKNVHLKTITNLSHMEAGSTIIKNRGMIIKNLDQSGKVISVTFHEGYTPRARFIRVAGVHHPSDFESSMMATVMAHFESLKTFFDDLNATQGMIFPQHVMMQPEQGSISDREKQSVSNNASYSPGLNLFILNQSFGGNRIRVSMNSGVLAHEYFHSVFDVQMKPALESLNYYGGNSFNHDSWMNETWDTDHFSQGFADNAAIMGIMNVECAASQSALAEMSKTRIKKSNKFLMGAINEGMADYFAYEFTKNPSWALVSDNDLQNRDVALPKQLSCNDDGQKNWLVRNTQSEGILKVHYVGTVFAHFLYLTALERKKAGDETSTQLQVIKFLSTLNNTVLSNRDETAYTLSDMAEIFISVGVKDSAVCTAARKVFPASHSIKTGYCKTVGE